MPHTLTITGRWARDPKVYNAGEQSERLNGTLVFNERVGNENVGRFIDVAMWGKGASNVERYSKKGDEVHVTGRLTQREVGKDSTGQYDRPVFSIIANSFNGIEFGRKKGDGAAANGNGNGGDAAPTPPADADEKVPF